VEDFFKVFVGVRGFVDGVLAGVVEDVVGFEVGVDLLLVEIAGGGFAAHAAAGTVIDAVAAFHGIGFGDHDHGTIARISGQQDRVAGFGEGRVFERVVAAGEGTRGAFAVDPRELVIDDFLTRDVVADEVHELPGRSWQHFLEGLQHERIDEHVVHGGEVRPERHVVEIRVRLGRSERGIDELFVFGRKRQTPGAEEAFQRLELALREDVPEPARSAVAEEGDVIVPQAENFSRGAHRGVIGELHDLALTEVVSTTVGAELHHLLLEGREAIERAHLVEALVERGNVPIVANVRVVFATQRPLGRDAKGFAHALARTFGANLHAEIGGHATRFFRLALPTTCSRRCALHNGFDQAAADGFIHDLLGRNVHLEQRHGALDVHADWPWINVCRRDHHAAHRRSVTAVRVGIEHEIGHARSRARVERLLDAGRIKPGPDRLRSDNGDGLSGVVTGWEDGFGFSGDVEGGGGHG